MQSDEDLHEGSRDGLGEERRCDHARNVEPHLHVEIHVSILFWGVRRDCNANIKGMWESHTFVAGAAVLVLVVHGSHVERQVCQGKG